MAAASVTSGSDPMLTDAFVQQSRRPGVVYDREIESTQRKTASFALTIWDKTNGKNLPLNSGETIGSHFSQLRFGGNSRVIITLLSYLVILHENGDLENQDYIAFSKKVHELSLKLLKAVKSNDSDTLKNAGRAMADIDHFPAPYVVTELSEGPAKNILPNGPLKCKVKVQEGSGHLIAEIDKGYSEALLEAYRDEIKEHLSEEGAEHLQLPDVIGHAILAFRSEYNSNQLPEGFLDSEIELSFDAPYIVPARGDNRYSLVVSAPIDFTTDVRQQLGLPPFSEERPPRITFAAVRNKPLQDSNETLLQRIESAPAASSWLEV